MRVYLDNCCYNRPFDEGGGVRVGIETVAKLKVQDMMRMGILMREVGAVEAERFVAYINSGQFDYTKWREKNLYVGATLHEVAERARAADERYRARTTPKNFA